MSKSVLYAANTSTQDVAIGGKVNFGSVVRKYGCNCYVSSGDVVTQGSGYYKTTANITVTAETAGVVIATIYKDGSPVTGANASVSVAADGIASIVIPCITRNYCGSPSTISVVITGTAVSVSNAAVIVEKE